MFHLRSLLSSSLKLAGIVKGVCLALALLWLSGCVTPTPSSNVTSFNTVVVDAGHGGHDSGALSRGRRGRVAEKDLALDVSRRVEKRLRAAGLRVVMTRSGDVFIPLDTRVAISNQQSNSVFVSIHFNASRKRGIHGAEVYHNSKGTHEFARRIARKLDGVPTLRNRGVKHAEFRVLRNSRGPAILVECSYLTNPAQAAQSANPAYREQVAAAIASAIIEQRR